VRTALAGVGVLARVTSPAGALIHNVSRINNYSLSFDDARFSNPLLHLNIRQDRTADAPGNSRSETWAVLPNSTNVTWEAFEGVTLTNVVFANNQLSGTITSPAGLPGYTLLNQDSPPNGTNFDVGLINDRYRLTVSLQSGGGVDAGFPSSWTMTIPGDWSQPGTGFHQHELVSYNPGWTLIHDFEYDAALDATVFEIGTSSYQTPPSPNFRLYGVPSPGTAIILALSIYPFAGMRRRNR
jgi:hypothetical protein